jgi:hypothetical protein
MKNKNWKAGLAALLLIAGAFLLPGVALAEVTVTYETEGQKLFSFQVPDGWEIRKGDRASKGAQKDARRIISVLPNERKQVMWAGFWSPPKVKDLTEVTDYLRGVAPKLLPTAEIAYRDERTINGKAARIVSGTGEREGRDFDFALIAIQIAKDRVAISAFVGEPEAYDKYEKSLIKVMNSIKEVGAGK